MKTSLLFSVLFVLLILALIPAQSLAGSYSYSGNDRAAAMPEWDKMYANKASRVDFAKAFNFGAYISGVCDATRPSFNTAIQPAQNKENSPRSSQSISGTTAGSGAIRPLPW
jgi:hypothetical protein